MGSYTQGAQSAGNYPAPGRDVGFVLFGKTVAMKAAGNATLDATTYLPEGAQLVDVLLDTVTVHTSASATVAGGTSAAGGTELFSATDVTTAPRSRPTFTSAQLLAGSALARNSGKADRAVYLRMALGTPTSVGLTNVTLVYAIKAN